MLCATQPFLVSSRNAPPSSWGGALRDDSKNGFKHITYQTIRSSREGLKNRDSSL